MQSQFSKANDLVNIVFRCYLAIDLKIKAFYFAEQTLFDKILFSFIVRII